MSRSQKKQKPRMQPGLLRVRAKGPPLSHKGFEATAAM
jgi:hypothetical protein